MLHSILIVFISGFLTALATGLGAIPFFFVKTISPRIKSLSNSVASGLMLGACFGLVNEGSVYGPMQIHIGAALGVIFILLTKGFLHQHEDLSFGEIKGKTAAQIILVLGTMTFHSFAEGVAVGVSFGGSIKFATLITLAIAVHNIPEGLAISAVMRPKGASLKSCIWWSIFSSLPQPLMAVPAFIFVELFKPLLPYGLGFAAGAMVFIVFLELLPEAFEDYKKSSVGLWVTFSFGLMVLLQKLL